MPRTNDYWKNPEKHRAQSLAHYYRHREECIARRKAYAQTERGKERSKAAKLAYYHRHKDEQRKYQKEHQGERKEYRRLHHLNGKSLQGLVKRPYPDACELCGYKGHLSYHHFDDNQLETGIWICPPCHHFAHRFEQGVLDKYLELKASLTP